MSDVVIAGFLALCLTGAAMAPLAWFEWRGGGLQATKRLLPAAGIIVVLCILTDWAGLIQQRRCFDAGYQRCFDAGGTAIQWIMICGFAVVALGLAYRRGR